MDDLEMEYMKLSDILNNHMTLETIDTTKHDFLTPTILIPIIHMLKSIIGKLYHLIVQKIH